MQIFDSTLTADVSFYRYSSAAAAVRKGTAVKHKNRNMLVTITAAVLLILAITVLCVRFFHRLSDRVNDPSASNALSSGETHIDSDNTVEPVPSTEMLRTTAVPSETPLVTYPAESLPDYEVHTLPVTTEEMTTAAPETTPTTDPKIS